MRLIACPTCHTQYDVSDVAGETLTCRCGEVLANRPQSAVEAGIHRCGACGALVAADARHCEYCGSAIVRDRAKLSLICPECYAQCPDDARFCTACGVAFRPEEPVPPARELPCPACDLPMPARRVAAADVHECLACRGLWAPGESFERLVARAIEARRSADPARLAGLSPRRRGANPAAQGVQYRKCPDCSGYMQRRNFRRSSGVIIDTCRDCGTWLDADELEAIAGFLLGGGAAERPDLEDPAAQVLERRAAAAFTRIRVESGGGLGDARDARGLGSLADLLLAIFR